MPRGQDDVNLVVPISVVTPTNTPVSGFCALSNVGGSAICSDGEPMNRP